jgi:hypothetical protein
MPKKESKENKAERGDKEEKEEDTEKKELVHEIGEEGRRLKEVYEHPEKMPLAERRKIGVSLSSELARMYGRLAEYDISDGNPLKAGRDLKRAGQYMSGIADALEDSGDVVSSIRYRESAMSYLRQAEVYAAEGGDKKLSIEIKDRTKKEASELEKLAEKIERVRARIAAAFLFGVLALFFAFARITGFVVSENVKFSSSVLGAVFFVLAILALAWAIKIRNS